jgi:hypothetical protein
MIDLQTFRDRFRPSKKNGRRDREAALSVLPIEGLCAL